MNILDSSGWLAVVSQSRNAAAFLEIIEAGDLVVPAITLYEVRKRTLQFGSETAANQVEQHMRRFPVIDLTADRASAACKLAIRHKLPMADSIIYAATLEFNATLWTQDEDFKGLPKVRWLAATA